MQRVHVVALNHQHFVHWCREVGVSPFDFRVIYVADARELWGYTDVSVIFYGPCHDRKDMGEIDQQLAQLKAVGELREPIHQNTPRRPSFFR